MRRRLTYRQQIAVQILISLAFIAEALYTNLSGSVSPLRFWWIVIAVVQLVNTGVLIRKTVRNRWWDQPAYWHDERGHENWRWASAVAGGVMGVLLLAGVCFTLGQPYELLTRQQVATLLLLILSAGVVILFALYMWWNR